MEVLLASHLLCAVVYLALAGLLALHSGRRTPVLLLIGACATTGLWALAVAVEAGRGLPLSRVVASLDVLEGLAWIAFLGAAYRAGLPAGASPRGVVWALAAAGALGLLLVGHELHAAARAPRPASGSLFVASLYARLLLAIAGLMLAEALVRQARATGRWRVKYLCLGVGGALAYDLFVWSEALLFQRTDPLLAGSRGAVRAIAAPLIAVAAARNAAWSTELRVARRAALHTATLFGVAAYMLGLAAVGAALRATGGDWGRVAQVGFVFAGLLGLALLWFSPSARSLLKLQLGRYLFTHRHDYREQWHRFAEALSSPAGTSLGDRALQALAGIVGSPGGGLWLREGDVFARVAELSLPEVAGDEPAEGRFAAELAARRDRILEIGEAEARAGAPRPDWLPEWLRAWPDAWLLVPLLQRERAVGFAALARPPARRSLAPEDEELLRTAAYHAASYLVAEQTARSLEESRRFEELSKGLAFIAHDLRNLANQLTLTLANARIHIRNPEFQRDLLRSMEESVANMQRLLDKLAQRRREAPAGAVADFARVIRSALRSRGSGRPVVGMDLDGEGPLAVACEADRLASLSGHLIQNAIDAAGPQGHVTVRLRREGSSSVFEVEDDGPGMTPEFLRHRLRHPFGSTKPGGFGLGLYECRELARELGGELAVQTEPGRGTVARLRLPLALGAAAGAGPANRDDGE